MKAARFLAWALLILSLTATHVYACECDPPKPQKLFRDVWYLLSAPTTMAAGICYTPRFRVAPSFRVGDQPFAGAAGGVNGYDQADAGLSPVPNGAFAPKADAPAQKPAANKFPHAIERSGDAGRIISLLALLPDSGLPKELMDKAEAVGVFPKVTKETLYFTHVSQGYGVISARLENGWTMPAFYEFSGGGYGSPFAKTETSGVILLFMTKDSVTAFERGGVRLKGERKAIAGPVGTITDEQKKELAGAQILAYFYYNGKLNGNAFGKGFFSKFLLNPDNKINTPLYGMKGREVLAGKKVDTAALPAGILAFQEALQKYYGATK